MLERSVLKEGQTFMVANPFGDIRLHQGLGHGLYHRDTRFLSVYELTLGDALPQLLASSGELNFMTNLQMANPAMVDLDGRPLPPRTLSLRRNRFLRDGLHERIGIQNYNPFPVRLLLRLTLGADFRDMFDVRGYAVRQRRGSLFPPIVNDGLVTFSYAGLDGVNRASVISLEPIPSRAIVRPPVPVSIEAQELAGISGRSDARVERPIPTHLVDLEFELTAGPREIRSVTVHVVPSLVDQPPVLGAGTGTSLDIAFDLARDAFSAWDSTCTSIETDHELLNALIRQASHDLRLLSDDSPGGPLPTAGIPWFAVPFGRDALIAGVQSLILNPDLARAAVRFLAERQGRELNDWRDEQPGKVLHEVRYGEMASLQEVPHLAYYGSVDSTPLFLVVLGELLDWTADEDLAVEMLPHVRKALRWIDRHGDLDGDGFVEYRSRSSHGLRNQGWKDSYDAVSDRTGRPIEPPIALAEVQGYVYGARVGAANLLERLGYDADALEQRDRAASLIRRYEKAFWLAEERFYALALGPDKRPIPSVTSNPGHCLWTGLVGGDRAAQVAARLMSADLLCGWGVRTLSSLEPTFNPLSYHNGSVWPHDNSIIAAGLKRAGFDAEATRVASEVLEAGMRMPGLRLPELYCGFSRDRRYHSLPAQYPVSCSPQAWAAGSVFMFVQTLLGLRVDAWRGHVLVRPLFPDWLGHVTLRNLRVGKRSFTITARRSDDRMLVECLDSGGLTVTVEGDHALLA